jgi:hypothetical protein
VIAAILDAAMFAAGMLLAGVGVLVIFGGRSG